MEQLRRFIFHRRYELAVLALCVVYLLNSFIDVMDIDAAQYAALAMEMSDTGSYLEVYLRGSDYLDKPPLLFWLSSLSFKLFGVSNFTYKIPAILVLLLGLYSTYRFTLMWYDKRRAIYAALILGSSMAYLLMTNDVRTDGILTGFVIFSIWKLSGFLREGKWSDLVLGAIGAACAMMAKGPLGLVIIGMGLGGDLLLKRDWRAILQWKWIVFLAIVAVVLFPMCYGLYMQFDLHPEKTVYDLQGPSGLEFFFWTQSFGRVTGDIYWDNGAGFFFFFHTILWDFQPWILIFIPALIASVISLVKEKVHSAQEYISLCGFVFVFLALSLSNYKLPHYIFPLFPLAAVITADFLVSMEHFRPRILGGIATAQFVLMHVFFVVAMISYLAFFDPPVYMPILTAILFGAFWMVWLSLADDVNDRIVLSTVTSVGAFGLVMAVYFYPNLLRYQSPSVAASEIRIMDADGELHLLLCDQSRIKHSLDFYSRKVVPAIDTEDISSLDKGELIYLNSSCYSDELRRDSTLTVVKEYPDFRISMLNLKFLLKEQRPTALDTALVLIKN